jgi:hypothetical protein
VLSTSLVFYILLSVWLSNYTKLFKISKQAWLEMDLCGYDGAKNMHLINNINISIFVFLILVLAFKILARVLLLVQVLDLIGGEEINFAAARLLENISFTFLMTACSL